MEGSERRKRNNEGRISALPDELIYHIFSFLDMKDVVNTCLLSKKWQYLWMYTPTLIFDNRTFNCDSWGYRRSDCECEGCRLRKGRFKHFVNNVLALISSDLVKFQLLDNRPVKPCLVYTWVNAALARKVQDVDIATAFNQFLSLPHLLFSSKVKVLRLRLSCNTTVPNSICAAVWIKNLTLEYVTLPDGNTNGELGLSFPVLESLRIAHCDASHLKIISVSTPVLERLDFTIFNTDRKKSCKVKTCTPNLKSLTIFDNISRYTLLPNYCMEELFSLVSADIHIYIDDCVPFVSKFAEDCIKCFGEVASWMYNVQDLKLPVSTVQLLVDSPELLKMLPGFFPNLKHVELFFDSHKNFHMKAVLKFLGRAPHLETLILEGQETIWKPHDFGEEWTKEEWIQSLPLFNHMLSFEFRNFNGLNVELKFLELVLEKALVLRKMIIKTKKEWLQGKPKEEISSFSRSSSSVSISFQITEMNVWDLCDRRNYNIM